MEILLILGLLVLGYWVGSTLEKRHYRSIEQREAQLQHILIFDTKLAASDTGADSHMVQGSVVISVDYFKRFVAGLRKLVGGRLRSYETLLDRGRREAILRMKEDAQARGANHIFNVRYETASISKGAEQSLGSVEVLAYGTAVKR